MREISFIEATTWGTYQLRVAGSREIDLLAGRPRDRSLHGNVPSAGGRGTTPKQVKINKIR